MLWANNCSTILRREGRTSWIGPLPAHDLDDNPQRGNVRLEYRWQLRARAGQALSMDVLPRRCFAMSEQLLGPSRVHSGRRVAPTFGACPASVWSNQCPGRTAAAPASRYLSDRRQSTPGPPREHPGCHGFGSVATTDDVTVSRILLVGLIEDTPLGCGSFTLYPGSAHRLQDLAARLRSRRVWPSSEEAAAYMRELAAAIAADTDPVDCHGGVGTVVLMHRGIAYKVVHNYNNVFHGAAAGNLIRLRMQRKYNVARLNRTNYPLVNSTID
jgi:hypothetical protein